MSTTETETALRQRRARKEVFSCAISPELLGLLYRISDERDITLSRIGREALQLWLEHNNYLPAAGGTTSIDDRHSRLLQNNTETTVTDNDTEERPSEEGLGIQPSEELGIPGYEATDEE